MATFKMVRDLSLLGSQTLVPVEPLPIDPSALNSPATPAAVSALTPIEEDERNQVTLVAPDVAPTDAPPLLSAHGEAGAESPYTVGDPHVGALIGLGSDGLFDFVTADTGIEQLVSQAFSPLGPLTEDAGQPTMETTHASGAALIFADANADLVLHTHRLGAFDHAGFLL